MWGWWNCQPVNSPFSPSWLTCLSGARRHVAATANDPLFGPHVSTAALHIHQKALQWLIVSPLWLHSTKMIFSSTNTPSAHPHLHLRAVCHFPSDQMIIRWARTGIKKSEHKGLLSCLPSGLQQVYFQESVVVTPRGEPCPSSLPGCKALSLTVCRVPK